jgi:UDP-3-O-[3-hydroxymyristoyl] N-acetylglucosamine deacetylase
MDTTRNQRTIAARASVEGFGYWEGRDVRLEFHPAEVHTGIVFVRRDLPGRPRIAAHVANRVAVPRRTTLCVGDARVDMIEHVLAALAGLEIDNCEVWTDQAEMPGCDGSSEPFVQALDAAGIVAQDAPRACRVLSTPVRLGDAKSWVEAGPSCHAGIVLCYELDYGGQCTIGRQTFELTLTPESFRKEVAPSRTFMLKTEADWLLSQGLGGRATGRDLLVFGDQGPIDNTLRFPDECVRHKVLDMIGDLALAGCDWNGRFDAYRSGHRLNAELVRALVVRNEEVRYRRRCA